MIHQVLIGIEYLHSIGFFHGHLTPENIFIQDNDGAESLKITGVGYQNLVSGINPGDLFDETFYPFNLKEVINKETKEESKKEAKQEVKKEPEEKT
jgi:serine/threonine protein kinase